MKEQKIIIETKKHAAGIVNVYTQGNSPYNVKLVKELKCGLLFIVLTR